MARIPQLLKRIMAKPDAGEVTNIPKPDIKLPRGYTDEAQFLQEMREFYATDVTYDTLNRDAGIEDAQFLVGDQWDSTVRSRREAAYKPVLTINRLPAFVAQVLGSRRLNETDIKIEPDAGADKEVAEVREGLIRSIQKNTRAKGAYDNALAGAVVCGIGNFQLNLEYESDDVFEQKITINPILDHMAVVWDAFRTDPTGKDATRCFVTDRMSHKDFAAQWPWARPADVYEAQGAATGLRTSGWIGTDEIRIVDYWRMRTEKRLIAMLNDGAVVDVTNEQSNAELLGQIKERQDGTPYIRMIDRKFAQLYICSGVDVLEGPYNYQIDRIPVFRVPGWEFVIGNVNHRWGLLRFLKDPQRLHNYWRSSIAERLMQSPRATWIASDTAVAGREEMWRNAHLADDPLLIYSAESGQAPERVPPAQVEGALIEQANITSQDIKDVSNIHEANLGMPSNEVSGAAILARQRVSDTGTILYHDNLSNAIEECGRVANQLIPIVYNAERTIKIIKPNDKEDMVEINRLGENDITKGRYNVSVITGPSYATKRIEAAQAMRDLANAMPNVLAIASDLLVEAQDWPGAEKIADRLRNSMPVNAFSPEEIAADPVLQQKQQAAGDAQTQQMKVMMQQVLDDHMKKVSEIMMNNARAQHYQADAEKKARDTQNSSLKTASEMASTQLHDHLDAISTAMEAPNAGQK